MADKQPLRRWRYRVEEATGSLASWLTEPEPTYILEPTDCGPDKQWTVINTTSGELRGSAYGVFVDTKTLCVCEARYEDEEHECIGAPV